MDLIKLERRRQLQKLSREPVKVDVPVQATPAEQEALAAASAVLVALATTKECRVCGGASYLGEHTLECPIPELETTLIRAKCFEVNPKVVERNPTVRKDEENRVFCHGIPWDRWLRLNPAQRFDAIARRHNGVKATKIRCRFCNVKTFVITPLRETQRIDECWDCWSVRSRSPEGIRIAVKEALEKARWCRVQAGNRAINKALVRRYARKARAMLAILRETSTT